MRVRLGDGGYTWVFTPHEASVLLHGFLTDADHAAVEEQLEARRQGWA